VETHDELSLSLAQQPFETEFDQHATIETQQY
jgi:hypothetical protein